MNCHRVREAMFLVTDNELEPELLAPFREHLSFCPACASHFHYLEKLVWLIRERCSSGVRDHVVLAPTPFR